MKNFYFLSITCFLLSGCFGSSSDDVMYAQNNLRAPTRSSFQQKSDAYSTLPQSITQPTSLSTPNVSVSTTQPAVTPQQPLVQTIVIPQYTPQPTMYPYAQPAVTPLAYGTPQQITIPQQNAVIGNQKMVHEVPKIQNPIMQQPTTKQRITTQTEQIYPSWASSDYEPPVVQTNKTQMVSFKNPNRNETVQCDAVDVMCIASYQQQGYIQLPEKAKNTDSGYPKTDWDNSTNIPRW